MARRFTPRVALVGAAVAAVGAQAARVNGVIDETDINGILTSFACR